MIESSSPETLRILKMVYDLTCEELGRRPGFVLTQDVRDDIAFVIMQKARDGPIDATTLKDELVKIYAR